MTYLVRIKTIDEMEENHKVTIYNTKDAGHPENSYFAKHDDSEHVFDEDFDDMLPKDRVVEIEENGTSFTCDMGTETFNVDDFMIDDNYNA